MGEPFRDPMSAAALRLEQLASENKLLREELDALRRSVVKKQPATSPDVQALADRTLELLERLDANIDAHAAALQPMKIHDRPAEVLQRASEEELMTHPAEPPVERPALMYGGVPAPVHVPQRDEPAADRVTRVRALGTGTALFLIGLFFLLGFAAGTRFH